MSQPMLMMRHLLKWSWMLGLCLPPTARCGDPVPQADRTAWEVRLRLDGSEPPDLRELLRKSMGNPSASGAAPKDAELRIAGIGGGSPAGGRWIAEIRGVPGVEALVGAEAAGSHAIVTRRGDDAELAVRSMGPGSLQVMSPVESAGPIPAAVADLPPGCWLGGWVDLKRIDAENLRSDALKLADDAGFTLSGSGDRMQLDLRITLKDDQGADRARTILEELRPLLTPKDKQRTVPGWESEIEGRRLTIRLHFTESEVKQLIAKVRREMSDDANPDPAPSGPDTPPATAP